MIDTIRRVVVTDCQVNSHTPGQYLAFMVCGPDAAYQFVVRCVPSVLPAGTTPAEYGIAGDGIMALAEAWVKSRRNCLHERRFAGSIEPVIALGIDYHSRNRMYDGQTIASEECDYLDGAPCYSDGSSLQAVRILYEVVPLGWDALWAKIEDFYAERFSSLVTA